MLTGADVGLVRGIPSTSIARTLVDLAGEADRRRDAALAAEGYVVVRLTWRRVTREPGRVAAELRRVLAIRGGTDTN